MQFRVMGRDEIMERRKEEQVVLAALLAARQVGSNRYACKCYT